MAPTETYVRTADVRSADAFPAFGNEANASGVSWAAVIAGAFVTAALSVTLLSLGAGLGLSSISPWYNSGASAPTIGRAAIAWLIILEIIACSVGGYMAGRLRTKWSSVHSHEVYFRDTAHGFLVWAVAIVMTASFMAAASAVMVGDAAPVASANRSDGRADDPSAYYVDNVLRTSHPAADQNDAPVRAEVERIFAYSLAQKQMSADDQNYLAQLAANRSQISQADAQQRVANDFAQAQEAADAARKAAAHFLLWMFIALLIGAFCASYVATIGGRLRDHLPAA